MKVAIYTVLQVFLLCLMATTIAYFVRKQYLSDKYKDEIIAKHDKYRTLWYRTNEKCFYDSSRKYGLILNSIYNPEALSNDNWVDTIPVNENTICK